MRMSGDIENADVENVELHSTRSQGFWADYTSWCRRTVTCTKPLALSCHRMVIPIYSSLWLAVYSSLLPSSGLLIWATHCHLWHEVESYPAFFSFRTPATCMRSLVWLAAESVPTWFAFRSLWPVWVLWCRVRCGLREKAFPHSPHS